MSYVTARLPEGARRTSYEVPGGRLAAVEVVPADPRSTVLLVPGFTGSKEDFAPLLPLLAAAGRRAVAVDQRGQYESAGPDRADAYQVDALARDVLAVLAALDGPVHLLGHSFGGLVARAAVLQRPEAVRSLVLLGSGPGALPSPRADVLRLLRPVVEQAGLVAVADASDALADADPKRGPQPAEVRAFLRERMVRGSAAALVAMADALLGEPDRVDALAATRVPVLVAHGEDDDAWPPAAQREMAERLGAAYEVVPDALHSPAAENPEGTAKVLLAFWG